MSGRPTVITTRVVSLLVASFQNGLTVREACWQSGISHEAYYSRLRSDEQFADTMAKAQSTVSVNAKGLIAKAIKKGDLGVAKWWLERKSRNEFGRDTVPEPETPSDDVSKYTEDEIAEIYKDYTMLAISEYKHKEMARISKLGLPEPEKYSRYNELYALPDSKILKLIYDEAQQEIADGKEKEHLPN